MDASDQIWQLTRNLLQQLPSMLTLLGCIVFAVSRWRRYPKVSLFAVLALAFLLVHAFVFAIVYVWVPNWLMQDRPAESFQRVLTVIGLTYNTTLAVGFGLLLVSIFMQRPRLSVNAVSP